MNSNSHITRQRWALAALPLLILGSLLFSSCKHTLTPRQGWNKSYGPVVPHDRFPADCTLCHTGKNWTTIRADFTFDHDQKTSFALRGAHQQTTCLMCHNDRGPAGTFAARGCAGCHEDPHRATMGNLCSDCHDEQTWHPKNIIAKHNLTRFPLTGAHVAAGCSACHPGAQVNNFSGATTSCEWCHRDDVARTTSPNHSMQNWLTDCQRCHVPAGWRPSYFKHNADFPLTGGHGGLKCTQCHQSDVFFGLPTECVNCHLKDFQSTTSPNHVASGFGTDCTICHTIRGWHTGRPGISPQRLRR